MLLRSLGYIWTLFGVYWLGSALLKKAPEKPSVKSAIPGEFPFYRALRLLVLATVFSLLFSKVTAVGQLGKRFIPSSSAIAVSGFSAALVGLAIALWARVNLGKFWSDKVVLQTEHQLICTGPYARMRHPIYSGVLLGVLGTALVIGEWRGLFAFALLLVNYTIKARREERILIERFGEQFDRQRARTGFLLPRFKTNQPKQ